MKKSLTKYLIATLVLILAVFAGYAVVKFLILLFLRSLTTTLRIWLMLAVVVVIAVAMFLKGAGRRR